MDRRGERLERNVRLDDPAAAELFLEFLDRLARLAGLPAEVRVRGGRLEASLVESRDAGTVLDLRLELATPADTGGRRPSESQ